VALRHRITPAEPFPEKTMEDETLRAGNHRLPRGYLKLQSSFVMSAIFRNSMTIILLRIGYMAGHVKDILFYKVGQLRLGD